MILRMLFGLAFGLVAHYGLAASLLLSPFGLLLGGSRGGGHLISGVVSGASQWQTYFGVFAFLVAAYVEPSVRNAPGAMRAFLGGVLVTTLTAFLGGLATAFSEAASVQAVVLVPLTCVALDVFLVSPFLLGGGLGIFWWLMASPKSSPTVQHSQSEPQPDAQADGPASGGPAA